MNDSKQREGGQAPGVQAAGGTGITNDGGRCWGCRQ